MVHSATMKAASANRNTATGREIFMRPVSQRGGRDNIAHAVAAAACVCVNAQSESALASEGTSVA